MRFTLRSPSWNVPAAAMLVTKDSFPRKTGRALSLQRQQRREACADVVQHTFRGLPSDLHVARSAVHAAYLIHQYNSGNRQSRRKLHLRRPATFRACDRANHRFVCDLVIATRCEHNGGSPPCLFVAGVGRKIEPDEAAPLRQIHQRSSSPRGGSSQDGCCLSGVIPATSSSSVKRRVDLRMTMAPSLCASISTRVPSVSPARAATSRGTRTPRLLPHLAI